jgi:hypothetical protein
MRSGSKATSGISAAFASAATGSNAFVSSALLSSVADAAPVAAAAPEMIMGAMTPLPMLASFVFVVTASAPPVLSSLAADWRFAFSAFFFFFFDCLPEVARPAAAAAVDDAVAGVPAPDVAEDVPAAVVPVADAFETLPVEAIVEAAEAAEVGFSWAVFVSLTAVEGFVPEDAAGGSPLL